MTRNVYTSDFKDIIFEFFDYAFIHELYDCSDVRTLRVQVDQKLSRNGLLSYLSVQLKMFGENGAMIRRATETDISSKNYTQMTNSEKPLVCFLSIKKLLQQRSKFKNDSHPNKPMETKMNQGVTRRIQASTNSEGNVQFKKPDNIRITNKIEVSEGQTTLRMNKGENQLAVIDTHAGKTIVLSFDLLETFYHAVKPD